MFTAFCDSRRKWSDLNKATMHIDRKPAEQIQVDWVGNTMQVCNPGTGELLKVYIFVACLPYSSYLYAEGFYSMDEEPWIKAHVDAFGFFGGTTPILVPDNCKTAVIKNNVDKLVSNDQYRRMAEYYGVAIVPARPREPKDKGAVEMGVGVIERQAIAPLRNQTFFSLDDLNRASLEKVTRINEREFQKRDGSRISIYLGQEKDALIPLPARPCQMVARKRATVNFNYHVSFDGRWYSVPFTYVKREVEIIASAQSIAVVCDGARIALHVRLHSPKGSYSTNPEHMPDSHRDQTESNRFTEISFDERFSMIVDAERDARRVNKRTGLLRNARFAAPEANVMDVRYDVDRGLDRAQIMELSNCEWLRTKRNVVLTGASGAGKTWLARALGVAACNSFYTVRYARLPEMVDELVGDRTEEWLKEKKKHIKCDLMILDDWLLESVKSRGAREILEIVESRQRSGSLLLCSQFAPGSWHAKLGEGAIADAVIDRIVYNAHHIHIDGTESMRKRMSSLNSL